MKTSLKISLLVNLFLATMVCRLAFRPKDKPAEAPPPVASQASILAASPATVSATQPQPEPFRWHQLDATDYHSYVKNLRAIGCPEPTVRAIVTADVHAAFSQISHALKKNLAALADSSWSNRLTAVNSKQTWEAELQQLPGKEALEIAELLGTQTGTNSIAANDSLATNNVAAATNTAELTPHDRFLAARAKQDAERPVAQPLVFSLDPEIMTVMKPTPAQMEVINNLRQNFQQQLANTSQNPDDPAYLKQYQAAQIEADEQANMLLGPEFWLQAYLRSRTVPWY